MNKLFKRKWLKALRSKKYAQCTNKLKKVDIHGKTSYCCLGVLKEAVGSKIRMHKRDLDFGSHSVCAALPEKFRREAKISQKEQSQLVRMNDVDTETFGQIANWIEKNL